MRIKQIVKWFLFLVMFILSWYFVTSMRTTEFGLSVIGIVGQLYTVLICIVPLGLATILFLKLIRHDFALKNIIWQILIIALLVIALSEIWASSEEYSFQKKCTGNTSELSQGRCWPFTNNHLGYRDGSFYAGD